MPPRKKVKPSHARHVLGNLGVLSAPELEAVVEKYTDANGDMVYSTLVRDVNAFAEQRAEDRALSLTKAGGLAATPRKGEEDSNSVLGRLRFLVRTRSILIKLGMKSFDRTNRGTVTSTQFCRVMSSLFPSLSPSDIDAIASKYATPDGSQIKYMDLHRDVTDVDDTGASLLAGELRGCCVRGGSHRHRTSRIRSACLSIKRECYSYTQLVAIAIVIHVIVSMCVSPSQLRLLEHPPMRRPRRSPPLPRCGRGFARTRMLRKRR